MGLDNSKIGWDPDKRVVTYDGKYFLTPDEIGPDSRAYASASNFDNAYKNLVLSQPSTGNNFTIEKGRSTNQSATTQSDPLSDLLTKLGQRIDNPYQHEPDPRIDELVEKLNRRLNSPFEYDVENDPSYQAASRIVNKNAEMATQQALEEMNSRGILNSTITSDRASQIQQDAKGHLDSLIPELQANAFTRYQASVSGLYNLLNTLINMDANNRQMGFNEYNAGIQNLSNLAQLTQNQINSNREYDLETQKLNLNRMQTEIEAALNRSSQFGRVTTATDAAILGVPVGTPTYEAEEAARERAHEVQIEKDRIAAQERMNNADIASRERIASQDRAVQWARINNENTLDNFSKDMQIWQATGKAPDTPAMKHYGIQPGTEWRMMNSEKLNELKAKIEQDEIASSQEMMSKLPIIQAAYGTDQLTATAIYGAWENPTLEAAIADFKANQPALKQQGIDTDLLWRVINSTWNPQTKQWVLPDPSSPTKTKTKPSTSTTRDIMNWSIGGP